jgi:[ribosomal protein S5]-alanine N-acetyltransferase
MEVPAIRSARLDLVSLSPGVVEAILDGRLEEAASQLDVAFPDDFPDDDLTGFLRLRLGQMQHDPASQKWLVRALVLRDDGAMVGHAGFHGPPGTTGLDPGKAEIGYTVYEPFRGRGYATEAAVALMDWAEGDGIHQFVFSIGPWNASSLAIARKLGFTQTGEQWDEEDGLELVFELDRRSAPAG